MTLLTNTPFFFVKIHLDKFFFSYKSTQMRTMAAPWQQSLTNSTKGTHDVLQNDPPKKKMAHLALDEAKYLNLKGSFSS